MATICNDGDTKRILFTSPHDGERVTIYLGAVKPKHAERFKLFVETLVSAVLSNNPIDPTTSEWLVGLTDAVHAKLADAGLCAHRKQHVRLTRLRRRSLRLAAPSRGEA